MIKSKIVSLQQEMDGKTGLPSIWNGMSKFKVGFENGKAYTFFSKGNFKAEVGQEINYEPKVDEKTGQEKGTASIVRDFNGGGNNFQNKGSYKSSKDITISKLACLKASAEFHASGKDDQAVLDTAVKFYNWIQNG